MTMEVTMQAEPQVGESFPVEDTSELGAAKPKPGEAASAGEASTPWTPARRVIGLLGLFTLAVIQMAAFELVGLSALLLPALQIAVAARFGRETILTTVLLSPLIMIPAWCVPSTTVAYAFGRATIPVHGLVRGRLNLDRELRCPKSAEGCVVLPHDDITTGVTISTIRLLHGLFGPQRGAWAGPYPTRAEVEAAMKAAPVRGDLTFARAWLAEHGLEEPRELDRYAVPAEVRTPKLDGPLILCHGDMAMLFDPETGRCFASYDLSRGW